MKTISISQNKSVLKINKTLYDNIYSKEITFLKYPADWILRFYNMYLKHNMPKDGSGAILDYGFGSGNNSIFFIQHGYKTYGLDISSFTMSLFSKNLAFHNLSVDNIKNFQIIKPNNITLPFKDNTFDFILSNQVLYFLPGKKHISKLMHEFSRVLKPNGTCFFTMMGAKNYFITDYTKNISDDIYHILIKKNGHRLDGYKASLYIVKDEDELKNLFCEFEPVTIGYFDQKMFDMKSNFHWIFVGKNKKIK